VEAARCINYYEEDMTKDGLRLRARMKGLGIKKQKDLRRPAFLGVLLDILPRCIDIMETNGEVQRGYYSKQLTTETGEDLYNHDGHMNKKFIESKRLGPYPAVCKHAWEHHRLD